MGDRDIRTDRDAARQTRWRCSAVASSPNASAAAAGPCRPPCLGKWGDRPGRSQKSLLAHLIEKKRPDIGLFGEPLVAGRAHAVPRISLDPNQNRALARGRG